MESTLSPRSGIKNPIPPPTVTVRSEFPTVNRSRQQQSLTCLVTVEVPDGKWRADPEEFPNVPPTPSPRAPDHGRASKTPTISREPIYQNPELLEDATEELHARVDNWHGLDFSRYVTKHWMWGLLLTSIGSGNSACMVTFAWAKIAKLGKT